MKYDRRQESVKKMYEESNEPGREGQSLLESITSGEIVGTLFS